MISQQPYRPVTYMIGSTTSSGPAPMPQMGTMGGTMGMGQMGTVPPQVTSGSPMMPSGTVVPTTSPVFEQSYIENIFRLNLGKLGTFYFTYENNSQWNAKVFTGILEAAGRDHIIISDPKTGQRIVLLMVNFDYATFNEELTYQYPGVIGNPPTTRNYR
ncbi:spore coat protein GerQ [Paenibacillus tengchongensis]|uniref:spore coat protein GerQ n=1 Tax=Paenibacillus tengchongensis TaxID=2608684 RepID=UPI00124DFDB0|nr:spore coat protein GerQ [Paenibacillus tengchongensis]